MRSCLLRAADSVGALFLSEPQPSFGATQGSIVAWPRPPRRRLSGIGCEALPSALTPWLISESGRIGVNPEGGGVPGRRSGSVSDAPYLPAGTCASGYEPLVKPVAAIAGDRVVVSPSGIAVDGWPVAHTAQLVRDSAGRLCGRHVCADLGAVRPEGQAPRPAAVSPPAGRHAACRCVTSAGIRSIRHDTPSGGARSAD
jgi:hypothetical protein